MGKNAPLWQIWFIEDYMNDYSLIIWKCHHSFCDGVSIMTFHLTMADEFDISHVIPIKKINYF